VGAVTDADIRRATMHGLTLQASAADVMQRSPVWALETEGPARHLELLIAHNIDQLPIVDEQGRVVGLRQRRELAGAFDHSSTKVVILAGGFGRRLHPLTSTVPKPLLKVGDRPLLDTLLLQLARQGFRDITITVHYLADMIIDHIGDGSAFGVDVTYVHETSPLGTAGSVHLAAERAAGPVLVINSDILTRLPFNELLGHHVKNSSDLTMGMTRMDVSIPYGVIDLDHMTVTGVREKPTLRQFVSAGIYVLNPEIISLIPANQRIDMPDVVSMAIQHGLSVGGFPIVEFWQDIGRMEDYELANREYRTQFRERTTPTHTTPMSAFSAVASA